MDTLVEAPVITQPLNFKRVQSFIREIEIPFTNALKDYADTEKKGLGYEKFSNDASSENIFTSSGLCDIASVSLYLALKKKFGENSAVKIVSNGSKTYNFSDEQLKNGPYANNIFIHVRLVFKGLDGKNYFIDPTYGQVNSHLNRIIIDSTENEDVYYAGEGSEITVDDVTTREIDIFDSRISKLSLLKSSSQHQKLLKKLLAIPQTLNSKTEL